MTTPDPNASTNTTVATSALDVLVGPDKKFGTPEDLAKGKLEADAFIEKLKGEARDLRNLVTAQDMRLAKLEAKSSILDRLETTPNTGNQPVVVSTVPAPQGERGLTQDEVLKLVEQREVNSVTAKNKLEVDAVLAKQLGANAGAFVLQKAQELGMEPTYLRTLALTSPKAFYNMLGIDPNASQTGTLYNGSGRSGPTNKSAEVRNKAYYDALQSKVGVKAFVMDRRIQSELHKDMQTMGEAFFA